MAEQRRYRVSGIDEHGDIHAFETDNLGSAEEMRAIMGEDLQDVELLTSQAPSLFQRDEMEVGGNDKLRPKPA
jgi:hypothetical protein